MDATPCDPSPFNPSDAWHKADVIHSIKNMHSKAYTVSRCIATNLLATCTTHKQTISFILTRAH